ncbi:MAG TPA: aldose 1-epimerase [Candidatus Binataceae bacterium]|nr:aldose 1-epimerase [Candidatus Binataceae bacterium]
MDIVCIEAQGERATFLPEFGFHCLSYKVGSLDVIAGPADAGELHAHPFRSGIPILFPFAGRIADGRFSYRLQGHQLTINEPEHGNAIHGLIYDRAFTVARRGPFYVRAEFDSSQSADFRLGWPWPFVFGVDYEVGNGLRCKIAVTNTGASAMPMALGAHPYFHAPLDSRGSRDGMQIQACARRFWRLDRRMLPTGEISAASSKLDIGEPIALAGNSYDDVMVISRVGDDAPVARLIDHAVGAAVELRADTSFRELVVYAPRGREVVAFEPYTAAPDCFNLAARGIDAGMIELQPGARFEASFEIRVSAL